MTRLLSPLAGVLTHPVTRWSTAAQQQARRNAMVAATALAQRRAEREEVEEFLAGLAAGTARPGPGAAVEGAEAPSFRVAPA